MSGGRELACGPDCIWPEREHIEPRIDWIGDWPIAHGEDDERPEDEHGDAFCLCGHPMYLTCPRFLSEGVLGMTIEAAP